MNTIKVVILSHFRTIFFDIFSLIYHKIHQNAGISICIRHFSPYKKEALFPDFFHVFVPLSSTADYALPVIFSIKIPYPPVESCTNT